MNLLRQIESMIDPGLRSLLVLVVAGIVGGLLHTLAFRLLRRVARRTRTQLDDALVSHFLAPSRILFPLLLINLVLPTLNFSAGTLSIVRHALLLALIGAMAWTLVRVAAFIGKAIEHRYNPAVAGDLMARQIRTKTEVLQRVVVVVVIILAGAAMLMTFQLGRQLGTSILASAGIAGIVVGMAAQQTLKNLIAGVQIAIAQPIRIEDIVVVEGEWGRVEEIAFTFVVVRTWDLRRMVLPISYFIEKPFQNWTRGTGELLGAVFLYLDYGVRLDEVRAELQRIVEESELWDRKACGLQVTNCSERAIEVRVVVSAADASKVWELRCAVREQLLAFVQAKYPSALPRTRTEVKGGASS